jgi:hypothetical protein
MGTKYISIITNFTAGSNFLFTCCFSCVYFYLQYTVLRIVFFLISCPFTTNCIQHRPFCEADNSKNRALWRMTLCCWLNWSFGPPTECKTPRDFNIQQHRCVNLECRNLRWTNLEVPASGLTVFKYVYHFNILTFLMYLCVLRSPSVSISYILLSY